MSFLQNHHIIPQLFADNEIIGELVRQRLFDLEGGSNRIYLPAAPELAASMGLSAHSGGHLDSYYNGVSGALGALADETDPAARASKLSDLVDSMRVALASGHLYANVPARMTQDEVDSKNRDFFGDWSGYAKAHKDQIAAVRALEQQGADSQQPGLVKWSAIINDPQRVLQLKGAIAKNPGVNITAGNQDLGGTPFAKFAVTDSIPDLPGSTPLRSNDLPPLPGLLPQTDTFGLPGFSAPKAIPSLPGFTPSNPFLQLPGFPPAQAGFAGPQTLTRSPAQIVSDDFATASQARLNDTFTAPTEPGLESGDAIFALLPLILAAAPELAAGAPAVLARVAARGPIEAAATRVSQAGAGGGLIEAAKRAAQAATGGGLFAAATPSPAMETPVG
ncbi:MAG TPA: AHH domain-containing protein, partial [Blastocatellia bacterium]|nr:AHH domain-containing protein [Blastocatellia bacterium]